MSRLTASWPVLDTFALRTLTVLLVVLGLLAGLLALHSTLGTHGVPIVSGDSVTSLSAVRTQHSHAPDVGSTAPVSTCERVDFSSDCGGACEGPCKVMAAACLLILAIFTMAFLVALPGFLPGLRQWRRNLLTAAWRAVQTPPGPSLALLCISRT